MKKLRTIALALICLCLTGSFPGIGFYVDTSGYHEDLDSSRVKALIDSVRHKSKPFTIKYPLYFDFPESVILVRTPIDSLKIAVDSVMHELDNKISNDNYYYYLKLFFFNPDEKGALDIIQENRGVWIENWSDWVFVNYRRRILNDLSDYYELRDWYYENKENINWLKKVEEEKKNMERF